MGVLDALAELDKALGPHFVTSLDNVSPVLLVARSRLTDKIAGRDCWNVSTVCMAASKSCRETAQLTVARLPHGHGFK